MSTTEAMNFRPSAPDRTDEFDYKPLSSAAVGSVVFGLLSVLIFFAGRDSLEASVLMTPLPLIGIALAWRALARMRANPDQFSGGRLAKAGLAISALCLLGGVGYSGYVYATEVPPGYARTSFLELKPSENDDRAGVVVPPQVADLDGKKVFIKGYIRPDSVTFRQNADRFLLVRDNNQCCFGDIGTVKYFDQVAVAMKGSLRVDYASGVFRVGGILHVIPENAAAITGGPVYVLEADYVN